MILVGHRLAAGPRRFILRELYARRIRSILLQTDICLISDYTNKQHNDLLVVLHT